MRPAAEQSAADRFSSLVTGLAMFTACAAAILTVLPWLARFYWAFDLLANFPVQVAMGSLVAMIALIGAGQRAWAAMALVVFIVNVARPAACYLPAETSQVRGTTCRMVCANVLSSNRAHAKFIDFIRTADPDFFFVLEMNGDWLAALQSCKPIFHTAYLNRATVTSALASLAATQSRAILFTSRPRLTSPRSSPRLTLATANSP
jgi:hypothetical protein